jgi:hypothetical protein
MTQSSNKTPKLAQGLEVSGAVKLIGSERPATLIDERASDDSAGVVIADSISESGRCDNPDVFHFHIHSRWRVHRK